MAQMNIREEDFVGALEGYCLAIQKEDLTRQKQKKRPRSSKVCQMANVLVEVEEPENKAKTTDKKKPLEETHQQSQKRLKGADVEDEASQ